MTVALDENTTLEAEFRHIKQTVLEWVANRGKKCTAIKLTVILTPEEVAPNKEFITRIFYEEEVLGPILQKLPFGVYFVDASERLLEEYVPEPASEGF